MIEKYEKVQEKCRQLKTQVLGNEKHCEQEVVCKCEGEGRVVECDDDSVYCYNCKKKIMSW